MTSGEPGNEAILYIPTLLVKLVCMACYLYSEGENQPAIPACNCHYAGQAVLFPIYCLLYLQLQTTIGYPTAER